MADSQTQIECVNIYSSEIVSLHSIIVQTFETAFVLLPRICEDSNSFNVFRYD